MVTLALRQFLLQYWILMALWLWVHIIINAKNLEGKYTFAKIIRIENALRSNEPQGVIVMNFYAVPAVRQTAKHTQL